MREEEILSAVDQCFDAVFLPDTWPQALHRLARALDAGCTMFYPRNPDTNSHDPRNPSRAISQLPASWDYFDLLQEYTANRWYLDHYRALRGFRLLDSGRPVVIEHDLATDEERKTFRHYNELYLPFGFPGFAMLGFEVAGQPWAMPFLRGTGQGHFSRKDARRLVRLIPEVRRMIRLMDKIGGQWEALGLALFDELEFGALLVDGAGCVLNLNKAAESVIGAELRLRSGRLSSIDAASDARLQRFMAQVTAVASTSMPEPISVTRRLGRSPLRIDAIRLKGVSAEIFRRGHALLIIEALHRRRGASPELLAQAFNLSPAQARLAYQIGSGIGLPDAAELLHITRETARSTLKAIFLQTDTHRQSELVALLEQAKSRLARNETGG
ncbi:MULTISPECIES: helix-turn-helix transcriptional regulator [unclassified Sinorhizobium]|uniref:helix-turn-helix transcriptional regulator n=1 Tax=unclassified Sinorhizobium TaxID=2613772 RepID=UPI0035257210